LGILSRALLTNIITYDGIIIILLLLIHPHYKESGMGIEHIFMAVLSGLVGLMYWNIKHYITMLEDLETRVVKLETVLSMLGDIRSEISIIKSDVEVIKSKIEK